MTPAQALKAIEEVLTSPSTKSDKARALYALGLEKTEVAELVPMNYSQAHSVWVKGGFGGSSNGGPTAGVRRLRQDDEGHSGQPQSDRRALHLTPTQTRYVTHDGHEVVRVDKLSGAECYSCGERVVFSIFWLGFVHAKSKEEPTNVEDRYAE